MGWFAIGWKEILDYLISFVIRRCTRQGAVGAAQHHPHPVHPWHSCTHPGGDLSFTLTCVTLLWPSNIKPPTKYTTSPEFTTVVSPLSVLFEKLESDTSQHVVLENLIYHFLSNWIISWWFQLYLHLVFLWGFNPQQSILYLRVMRRHECNFILKG